jgi:hypothetical protein
MPKTNDQTGATYAGNEGVVEHGAPIEGGRILSELDPERNLDGTLIEGDHPDHADGEERDYVATTDPRPLPDEAERDEDTQNLEPVYNADPEGENPDRNAGPVKGKGATQDDSADTATPNTIKPASARGKK